MENVLQEVGAGQFSGNNVVVQLETFAKVRALATGDEILFGTIDGEDSKRLAAGYPKEFK